MKTHSAIRSICVAAALTLGSTWLASAVNVTFQVNMSIQAALGNFTPGVDAVQVAGSFNAWTPASGVLSQNVTNADVYEGTFNITGTTGSTISYKFVYGAAGWEADGVGPGGVQNRQFALPATDTVLPVVYFNNLDTLPATRDVTFRVNLGIQISLGNFDPGTDFAQVAGEFNGWSTTASQLFPTVADTNVYEGTFAVAGNAGGTVNYKFMMATFALGDKWEDDIPNRQLILAATNQELATVWFDNLDSVPITNAVTFQVNMAAQMALGNFVNGVNGVAVAGSFNNWNAVDFVLTNTLGNPTVYQGTTNVVGGAGSPLSFQYVIDGVDWEEAVGNRTFNLATNSQTEPLVFWNNVGDLGPLTLISASGSQIDVSWTPAPLVRLQVSTGLPDGWTDVPGSTGQSNATVNVTTDETYLRLIGP